MGHNFLILHYNIRSSVSNYDEFSVLLDTLKIQPEILVLTETLFTNGSCSEIPGYNGHHICRDARRGGRISIYVKNSTTSSAVSEYTYIRVIELNTVKLILNSRSSVMIIGAYRPGPRIEIPEFSVILGNISEMPGAALTYVVGDMNIDMLSSSGSVDEYCAILQSISFLPVITVPTRVADNTSTLIDYIWTNQLHEIV